jgi:hypothetical protein
MADRGFVIRDLLLTRKATLKIPPFTTKCKCINIYFFIYKCIIASNDNNQFMQFVCPYCGSIDWNNKYSILFYTLCVLFFNKWFTLLYIFQKY